MAIETDCFLNSGFIATAKFNTTRGLQLMNTKFRFRAPATIRMALCCLAAGLCVSFAASAQEYTLRDLVEEYDAMIVARINSKEAMEKTVKISGHDGVISTAQEIFTIHEITLSEYVGPEGFAGIRGFVLPDFFLNYPTFFIQFFLFYLLIFFIFFSKS